MKVIKALSDVGKKLEIFESEIIQSRRSRTEQAELMNETHSMQASVSEARAGLLGDISIFPLTLSDTIMQNEVLSLG